MEEIKVIELKQSILENNDLRADALRRRLRREKTFLLNLMSSPGSGKTSLLLRTLAQVQPHLRCGVLEADIDSSVDARRIAEIGVPSVQVHTGGMCHLDAAMTETGLSGLDTDALDCVILENIGNLVCPAEFDTGAVRSVMLLSVPEGDDKPLKYPLMFSVCDAVIISKLDCMPYFDFDLEAATRRIQGLNPHAQIFPLSAKTGQGMQAWLDWFERQVTAWNSLELDH